VRDEVAAIVGAGSISERPVHDHWPLGLMRMRTAAPPRVLVARPGTYDQVVELVRWGRQAGVVMIPVGGASGVCGAVEVEAGQLALDLTALNRILDVDSDNLLCRVQAGVLGMDLEQHLLERGLTWGHYPSSLPVSTVGGLISTRSSGQESTRHGNIEDQVLAVKAVLTDGTLVEMRPPLRSAAGPALHQLLVGAEGGLAVILEASLGLHRLPEAVIGRGYAFTDVASGLDAMRAIVQADLHPLVMRLYDAEDTSLSGLASEGCLLLVAVAGPSAVAAAEAEVVATAAAAARPLGEEPWTGWKESRFSLSADRLRRNLEPAGSFLDTIEIATTWTSLPALHAEVKSVLAHHGFALCHFSHAYRQGCCAYFTIAGSAATEGDAEAAYRAAWASVMAAVVRSGGTISHHHGVGRARRAWIQEEMGGWWSIWEAVRAALDPGGNLNPGAVGGSDRSAPSS
jgi:alkyldihydroxyacetonephosphate synthase